MTDLDPAGRGIPDGSGLAIASRGIFASVGGVDLHTRTKIRRNVVEALQAEAGGLAGRIHDSPVLPVKDATLPAALVYTRRDRVVGYRDESSPRILVREIELVVEVLAWESSDLAQVLDSHAKVVEYIVQRDEKRGGHAESTVYDDTQLTFSERGSRLVGSCRINFKCTYAEETQRDLEPELAGIDIDYDLGPAPDRRLEAEDRIDFEE